MKVTEVIKQCEIKGLEDHSVRLDILAEGSSRRIYDIEIQRRNKGNLPLRSRYYSRYSVCCYDRLYILM